LSDGSYHAKFVWFLQKRFATDIKYLPASLMKVQPLFQNPLFIKAFERNVGWDAEDKINIK